MIKTNFIEISNKAQEDTRNICRKFYENAEQYVKLNCDDGLSKKILSQTDAVLFKFVSAAINLEFLWQIHYQKKDKAEFKEHTTEWQNNLSFTDSIFFENTIIQIRAFLDFTQKLSCLVLNYTKPIDGTKDFFKILSKMNTEKSKAVEKKFNEVLNDRAWGNKLKSIRDKIIHYDIIKTKSEFRPTIQSKQYQKFCQELENDMFVLLTELQEILFEQEWKAG